MAFTPPDRRKYPAAFGLGTFTSGSTPRPGSALSFRPPVQPRRTPATPLAPQEPTVPYPGYMTPQEMLDLALKQAQAGQQPLIDLYREQQAAAQKRAQDNAAFQQSLSAALAQLMGSVSPNVQGIYREATADSGAMGKGFSDAMRASLGDSASDLNQQMTQLAGAPSEQNIDPGNATAAGDALYALGGYIPGQQMARAGAGFASAAAFLPATALGEGQRAAGQALREGEAEAQEYDAQIMKLISQLPADQQKLLADLQGQQFDLAKWYEDQKWKQRDYELDLRREERMGQPKPVKPQVIQNAAGIFSFDPATGKLTQLQQLDPKKSRPIVVGSDKQGRKVLDLDTGQVLYEVPPVKGTPKKSSAPQFTAKQIADFKKTAGAIARNALGTPAVLDKNGKVVIDKKTGERLDALPPLTYQQAIAELLQEGVPLNIAQQALNRYWRKGARITWWDKAGKKRTGVTTVRDGFILMPWEENGQGRPLVPIQQRGKGKAGADPAAAPTKEAASVVQLAAQQIGQKYVWGAEDRKEGGFDCSGLIDWAYRQIGIDFPGRLTTYTAMTQGREVDPNREKLMPGDLLITNNKGHMVMYVGNDKVIAASSASGKVVYQPLSYHLQRVVPGGIRRVLGANAVQT